MGKAGQVVGIVGIVVSLLLAVGVIAGRGWAIDQVDAVATTIDDSLAKGEPLLATVTEKVSDVDARLSLVGDAAAALAASDNPAPALIGALSDRLSGVSERYLELRAGYASARERIVSAAERLEMLDRLVPGFEIPAGPTEALSSLDARIQELDATMMQILGEGGLVESAQVAAQNVVDRVTQADAMLEQATDLLAKAEERLGETRAKVASLADTVGMIINIGSLMLVLAFLWIALLHWVLFLHSSGRRAEQASS